MKTIVAAFLFFSSVAYADDSADFVSRFELVSAVQRGNKIEFTVLIGQSESSPEFRLIARDICTPTYPESCVATLIRVDDSEETRSMIEHKFSIDVVKLLGREEMNLEIRAAGKIFNFTF